MMRAEVRWKEGLDFTGRADSGYAVELASATAETGSGASPMELVLIALAGCTAMDVISILQKKRQQVTGFEVRVQAEKTEEHPRVFTAASTRTSSLVTMCEWMPWRARWSFPRRNTARYTRC